MIPFNLPFTAGRESEYLQQALASQQISGKGPFGLWCEQFIEQTWGFERCLLTPSCSAALEMIALLLDLQAGDEVILPSFTFVSTANAFVLRGAVPVFCDSSASHPNLDVQAVEALITPKTRALVAVHYAGMACDLPALRALADKRGLYLIEDAAQAIDAYGLWGGAGQALPLGRFGHLAAFSFHETKNLMCGEGGCLLINDPSFLERAEILRDKGTNRSQFERGQVHHYTWCGLGGSYVLSELSAAYLRGQLEQTGRHHGPAQRAMGLLPPALPDFAGGRPPRHSPAPGTPGGPAQWAYLLPLHPHARPAPVFVGPTEKSGHRGSLPLPSPAQQSFWAPLAQRRPSAPCPILQPMPDPPAFVPPPQP
jgi:dTDP-4-amino-4,6-dideoxygalactose transaminase